MPPKRRSARVAENETSRKKVKVDDDDDDDTAPSPPPAQKPSGKTASAKTQSKVKQPSSSDQAFAKTTTTVETSSATPGNPAITTTSPPSFTSYDVPSKSKPIPCLRSHPTASPPISLIFTHGAGGGLSTPAMSNFYHGFASTGAAIACFQGPMNLKGRAGMFATVLDYEKKQTSDELDVSRLAFGGRSMGARAAVLASQAQPSINLLVLVSYPLVAPSGDVRDQILIELRPEVDVLFVSGDGDSMCDLVRLAKVRAKMKARTWMVVVKGADHGMNVKGGKKATEEVGKETGRIAARWIQHRDETTREMVLRWDAGRERVLGQWGDEEAVQDGKGADDTGGIKRYFGKKAQ